MIIETVYDTDTDLNNQFELPPNSVFYHLNTDILFNQIDVSNYSDKNVLLVGTETKERHQRVKQLKSMGFNRLVCLNSLKKWGEEFFDDWIDAEHEDIAKKDETLKAVLEYQERFDIEFHSIFTYDDCYVLMTSFLTTQLNLLGIPHELVMTLKHKYLFRKRCSELKIACPNFFLIESSQRMSFIERLKSSAMNCQFIESQDSPSQRCYFPVILKNNFGVGKDFIRKCQDVSGVVNALQESLDLGINILLEEFVSARLIVKMVDTLKGNEIDIDILIQDNEVKFMSISDNFPPKEPFFFEQGCITPSVKLNSAEKSLIRKLIKKWTQLLQFQNGCLHFEALCVKKPNEEADEDSFLMPVEINARIAAAETWSMVKAAYGVDLFHEHINISLGIRLQLDESSGQAKNRCITWDFREEFDSFIESIRINLADISRNEDAIEVAITRSPGDKLYKDFYGWLTVKTSLQSSELEVKASLEKLLSSIEFNIKKLRA